eukprot:9499542-Pyramimonas_sp.AAC.2
MEFEYQRISAVIQQASKHLRISARQYGGELTARRVEELSNAVKDNNSYLAQRLARLIAGKRRGPRQRKFAAIPSSAASARGWGARVALPSHRGSCSATPATIDEIETEVRLEHRRA